MANTKEINLQISGMSCGHCVQAVAKALQQTPGVTGTRVDIGAATVQADLDVTTPEALARAVQDAGYEARVA